MSRNTPLQVLRQYWAYDDFRPGQDAIIDSVLQGRDTFALLPTGGGKSLCYQVPALCMEGVCLVISPLIALMQDQVNALQKRGIPAAMFYSDLSQPESDALAQDLAKGQVKILYLSPEKLEVLLHRTRFRQVNWSFLAVDEAHCISQWGHDFRPSYLRIRAFRELSKCPVLALTATATPEVQDEICERLELRNPFILKNSFRRNNISLHVLAEENKADKMTRILKKTKSSSLVYMRNRRHTVGASRILNQQGIRAGFYHAGLDPEARRTALERWLNDETPVMCCTNAFGMGVDKADVGLVLHLDMPDSLEEYFQEAGRAGRGGQRSFAVMLYHERDLMKISDKSATEYPPEEKLLKVYRHLLGMLPPGHNYSEIRPDLSELGRSCDLGPKETYSCIRCLEKAEAIQLESGYWERSILQIHEDPDALYLKMQELGLSRESEWIRMILRMYESVLDVPVKIHEGLLSQSLQILPEELQHLLFLLDQMQLAKYEPHPVTPLTIRIANAAQEKPDLSPVNELRARFQRRLEFMKKFVLTRECRQSFILRYFGEEPEGDCGICDHCLDKKQKAISADQSKKYQSMILDILQKEKEVSLRDMLSHFPGRHKQHIEQLILELVGEEKIFRKFDKLIALSRDRN